MEEQHSPAVSGRCCSSGVFGDAIAGEYGDSSHVLHGYLRDSSGTLTEYDAPDAGKGAYQGTGASGINRKSAVTGVYYDSGNALHGYIRLRNGALAEFDAPDAAHLTSPRGINDSNAIAGYYQAMRRDRCRRSARSARCARIFAGRVWARLGQRNSDAPLLEHLLPRFAETRLGLHRLGLRFHLISPFQR